MQIWLEIITSRDAKSACFKGSQTSCTELISCVFFAEIWPKKITSRDGCALLRRRKTTCSDKLFWDQLGLHLRRSNRKNRTRDHRGHLKSQQLGRRKWGYKKWGLKGCLAALPGNRPKSALFALFLPRNPQNGGKRPFSSDILKRFA